jgi:hypothetical protein
MVSHFLSLLSLSSTSEPLVDAGASAQNEAIGHRERIGMLAFDGIPFSLSLSLSLYIYI